ncbi:hypothetical protein CYMTET_27380, partial [Cymbomonas tetramitiformis]
MGDVRVVGKQREVFEKERQEQTKISNAYRNDLEIAIRQMTRQREASAPSQEIDWRYLKEIEFLRGGACGEVFCAVYSPDGHDDAAFPVAVKFFARTAEFLEELEAYRNSGFHTNLAKHVGIVHNPKEATWALVTEMYDTDLDAYLFKDPSKSSPEVEDFITVRIGLEICKGAGSLHEKDLAHCDLKPANIFLDKDKHAKVGDLGFTTYKCDAVARGTLKYMCPKLRAAFDANDEHLESCSDLQKMGPDRFWHSVDIFAFGKTLKDLSAYFDTSLFSFLEIRNDAKYTRPKVYDNVQVQVVSITSVAAQGVEAVEVTGDALPVASVDFMILANAPEGLNTGVLSCTVVDMISAIGELEKQEDAGSTTYSLSLYQQTQMYAHTTFAAGALETAAVDVLCMVEFRTSNSSVVMVDGDVAKGIPLGSALISTYNSSLRPPAGLNLDDSWSSTANVAQERMMELVTGHIFVYVEYSDGKIQVLPRNLHQTYVESKTLGAELHPRLSLYQQTQMYAHTTFAAGALETAAVDVSCMVELGRPEVQSLLPEMEAALQAVEDLQAPPGEAGLGTEEAAPVRAQAVEDLQAQLGEAGLGTEEAAPVRAQALLPEMEAALQAVEDLQAQLGEAGLGTEEAAPVGQAQRRASRVQEAVQRARGRASPAACQPGEGGGAAGPRRRRVTPEVQALLPEMEAAWLAVE